MPAAESVIEERVLGYVRDVIARNEMPTRDKAIRQITGDLDVLPSAVARALTKLIEARTIRHLKSNDRLEFVD